MPRRTCRARTALLAARRRFEITKQCFGISHHVGDHRVVRLCVTSNVRVI